MQETITWISVEERLPDEYTNVLVPYGFRSTIAYRECGVWRRLDDMCVIRNVTHWVEMPKGPKNE